MSKQKKDAGGGEMAPRKGGQLPRRGTLSPSKGVEVALSAQAPREAATSGKISGKPPIAAGIAAVRMVVEGRDHVRTRGGLNTGDGDFQKRSWDATDEVTCTCDGCAQARGRRVSVRARALKLKRAASVAGGDVCVVCAVNMKVWQRCWGCRAQAKMKQCSR